MKKLTTLHVLEEEALPLGRDELQKLGNRLTGEARVAAVDAVAASMASEFVDRTRKTITRGDVVRWRARARHAIDAWHKVDALTSELLRAIDRTAESKGSGS